jgi:hypothetical protein
MKSAAAVVAFSINVSILDGIARIRNQETWSAFGPLDVI